MDNQTIENSKLSPEDKERLKALLGSVAVMELQMREYFESLWEQRQDIDKIPATKIIKDFAFAWFRIGYQLSEHRKDSQG